ncbi:hypothetical protein [Streptomyces sp. NPDC018031]|uniref:hypothetical protein n=1 Tax=Streptomyces sp. NPDC018031 TaxID=3365033 RepID=UPI003797F1FA
MSGAGPRPPRPGPPEWLSRPFFAAVTFACLLLALGICVRWFTVAPPQGRYEPAIQTFALVAAITGVFAERRAAARERRDQALVALADELVKNTEILYGEGFAPLDRHAPRARVYPRLVQSATDAALVSGVFWEAATADLPALLHDWRDAVHDFNRRLDLAELRTYVGLVPDEVLIAIDDALHREDGQLAELRRLRAVLERVLRERYGRQPGVAERLALLPARS